MEWSRLAEVATLSVSRACGFALLAIFCFMIGMAGYPLIALKTGAVGLMLTAAVLAMKAQLSPNKPYKRTEVWQMLDPSERPDTRFAQQLIGLTLRDVFLRFAGYFAMAGLACFAVAVAVQIVKNVFEPG
jgi:hypothetical protein